MSMSPGTRFGPYQVVGALGVGGMGEVYRATDTSLKRDVAIKVLPESFVTDAHRLARFQREAEMLASLNHVNIAQIYGLERGEGMTALVMELVEGPTLLERIAHGALSPNEALDIALQIAAALEAAHDQGIVHRDLKPANVKLKADGTVKVLDFGIAKALDTPIISGPQAPVLTTPAMTEAGLVLGTAAYMSPEQARGKTVDERADIWAFGCVLYEMLTGQPAFGSDDVTVTLARVLERDADMRELPAALSPAVRRTIELCLQKDLKQRVADVRDVRLALNGAFVARLGAGSADAAAPSFLARNSRLVASVASLSLLLAAAVSFLHFRESPPSQPTLRYTVAFPKEAESEGLYFNLHLSPDGRILAADGVVEETGGIFVRSLDSLEWRLLPGTGTGDFMWSPDSRSIAYFVGSTLTRVSVGGGPPQPIARVDGVAGSFTTGSWGRDVILVAHEEGGAILSVVPDGGEVRSLITPEPGAKLRYPAFLPNGRDFLYTTVEGSAPGIYLASVDDPAARLLLPDESSAIFAPVVAGRRDGHLIFARDGRLMAQPFDAEALVLRGDAFVLAERALLTSTRAAAVSASAGVLAYFGGRSRYVDSRLVWRDRAGGILTALEPAGYPSPVALSPDDKLAALVRRGDVWLRDLERGMENPFSSTGATPLNANVVWSPNGDRIAFVSATAGTRELRIADPRDLATAEPVLRSDRFISPTDWTDRYLIYTQMGPDTLADLWYVPMDGHSAGDPVAIRRDQFFTSFGEVSPDGRWLAYVSDEAGTFDVWVQAFPSGPGKWRVSDSQSLSTVATTQQPRWSRDGRELYFVAGAAGRATMMAAPVVTPLSPSAAPVGEPKPLFDVRVNSYASWQAMLFYDVSRDGQTFLINEVDEGTEPVINVVVNGMQPQQ